MQYSSNKVDSLLKKKLDSPTNTGVAGQVPVYQEDGSTVWGDMLTQDDVLEILDETGTCHPVMSASSLIYTSNTGEIYIL